MNPIQLDITRRNKGEITLKRETLTCKTDYTHGRKAAEDIFNFLVTTAKTSAKEGMEIEQALLILPEKDITMALPTYRIPTFREDDIMQAIVFLRSF